MVSETPAGPYKSSEARIRAPSHRRIPPPVMALAELIYGTTTSLPRACPDSMRACASWIWSRVYTLSMGTVARSAATSPSSIRTWSTPIRISAAVLWGLRVVEDDGVHGACHGASWGLGLVVPSCSHSADAQRWYPSGEGWKPSCAKKSAPSGP